LTGIGTEEDYRSWNGNKGFGSTGSGPSHKTCNDKLYMDPPCFKDCNDDCADICWWTTCQDSVAQVLDVVKQALGSMCVDQSRIYAAGESNGGMFTHELARDERSAKYFAGIMPNVGLPHYGFNNGPAVYDDKVEPISYFGIWGAKDPTVPPEQNPADDGTTKECRSSEEQGWFFTTAKCTTKHWAQQLECDKLTFKEYDSAFEEAECWTYSECMENVKVTGCIDEEGTHSSKYNRYNCLLIDFVYTHPKMLHLSDDESPIHTFEYEQCTYSKPDPGDDGHGEDYYYTN